MDSNTASFIIYIIISLVMAILLTKLWKEDFGTSILVFLFWPICIIILFFNFISEASHYMDYCQDFGYKKCYLVWFSNLQRS